MEKLTKENMHKHTAPDLAWIFAVNILAQISLQEQEKSLKESGFHVIRGSRTIHIDFEKSKEALDKLPEPLRGWLLSKDKNVGGADIEALFNQFGEKS